MNGGDEVHDQVFEMLARDFQGLGAGGGRELQIPPPVFLELQGRFTAYTRRQSLTAAFPILEKHVNPLGNMQGGIVAAAFDNVFGPLSFLVARAPTIQRANWLPRPRQTCTYSKRENKTT